MTAHPDAIDRPATYQDVIDAPPNMVAEIVDGALHLHPRPAAPHARAGSALGARLYGPFDEGEGGPGNWIILDEPELHLGRHVLVPDIAGWRRERMPEMPDAAAFDLAPDWICEILSPSTRRLDLTRKRAIYAEQRVGFLWLVDPDARTMEAFRLHESGWLLLGAWHDADEPRIEPFDAITLALARLWRR